MMKRITTLALATGLATAFAVGAQAQTISGTDLMGNQIFQVLVTPMVTPVYPTPGPYTYKYNVALVSTTAGVDVNSFDFNFNPVLPVVFDGPDTTAGYTEANLTPGAYAFAGPGLINVGDSAVFSFISPLPPSGTVGVTSNSSIGGGGHASIGPGPIAVPEPSTYALLGIGLLPLALVARRRMANQN